MENISGQTEIAIKDIGKIINTMERGFKDYLMADRMKETGLRVRCMEEVFINGRTDNNTKASIG